MERKKKKAKRRLLKHGLSRTARNVRSLMEKYFALRSVLRANNWRTPAKGRYISLCLLGCSSRERYIFVVGKKCAIGRIDRSRYEASLVAGIWNFFSSVSAGFLADIHQPIYIVFNITLPWSSWNFNGRKNLSRVFFFFSRFFFFCFPVARSICVLSWSVAQKANIVPDDSFRTYTLRSSNAKRVRFSLTW